MEKIFSRCEISNDVNFNVIKDERFKTGRISFSMFLPLEEKTASVYALLPAVLKNSCRKYPDFTSLNKKLADLYGASLFSDISKIGDMQALTISVSFLDDKFALNKENLSSQLTQLLCDVLFDPLIENGTFKDEFVNQEKRQLVELIESEYNDKKILAKIRCEQLMCKDEKFGISRLGGKDSVSKLTPDDVFDAWKTVLKIAKIEIMALGDLDENSALEIFKTAFSKIKRDNVVKFESKIIKKVDKVKEQYDNLDIAQSKLVMGFRTGVALQDEEVMATRIAVALFGATPQSKLFLNVREKLSLCYYCSAKYDRNKGIMIVQSGVEKKNIEKAKTEILNQLEEIKKGNFTDSELDNTKKSLANSYRTIGDFLSGLENFYLSQVFDGEFSSPEQFIEKINTVSREQIINAAKLITLDTIYALVGNEEVK